MNTLPASAHTPTGYGGLLFACVSLAGILCSCAGPKIQRQSNGSALVKIPAMNSVTITVTPDNTVTVESRPVPIWESIVGGLTSGLVRALTPQSPPQ